MTKILNIPASDIITLPAEFYARDFVVEGDFVYILSDGGDYKLAKINWKTGLIVTTVSKSYFGNTSVGEGLVIHKGFLYVGGQRATGDVFVYKCNKDTLLPLSSWTYASGNFCSSLASNGVHLFVGEHSSPGRVYKVDADLPDGDWFGTTLGVYQGGDGYVTGLVVDQTYGYKVAGISVPGTVDKFLLSNMSFVARFTAPPGVNNTRCITQTIDSLFVGMGWGSDTLGHIVKVKKADMTLMALWTPPDSSFLNCYGVAVLGKEVYASFNTTPFLFVKLTENLELLDSWQAQAGLNSSLWVGVVNDERIALTLSPAPGKFVITSYSEVPLWARLYLPCVIK